MSRLLFLCTICLRVLKILWEIVFQSSNGDAFHAIARKLAASELSTPPLRVCQLSDFFFLVISNSSHRLLSPKVYSSFSTNRYIDIQNISFLCIDDIHLLHMTSDDIWFFFWLSLGTKQYLSYLLKIVES